MTGVRAKLGRPGRLDRGMIARAVHEIGLDNVTMKAVADHLDVSVPGLYHYVEGRDDLMRLGAEYSASQIQVPSDRGQHWAEWLMEWARHNHDAFANQPELLSQFLHGAIGSDRLVEAVDAVIGLLVRYGFSESEALEAYRVVSQVAVGAAVADIREAEAARTGRPAIAEFHRELAVRSPEDLPHLRALLASPLSVRADFTDRVCTVLVGIAVRRGESPSEVLDHISGMDGPRTAGLQV